MITINFNRVAEATFLCYNDNKNTTKGQPHEKISQIKGDFSNVAHGWTGCNGIEPNTG